MICPTSYRQPLLAVIALLVAAAATAGANAQAAKGHGVPDPITVGELQRYADRLMLSDEQRQALQPFHDEYREQFRALREGEIDRYIDQMQRTGGAMPGHGAWQEGQQQRDRIHSRIRALDESLFAAIEPILTDEQRERLPRVRMARQRARAVPAAHLMMGRGDIVDLSELVQGLDLALAERERVDPLLANYEYRLTQLVEKLPDLVTEAWSEFFTRMEEIAAEMRQNPEAARNRQREMMTLMNDTFRKPQAHAIEIRALGHRAMFDMTTQLSDASARNLRNAFVRRAYVMQSMHLRSRFEAALEGLLRRDDLDAEQRSRIAEIATDSRVQIDAVIRQALEAADEHERQSSTILGDADANRAFGERMRGFAQRISEIDDGAMNALEAAMPEYASTPPQGGREGRARGAGAGTVIVRGEGTAGGAAVNEMEVMEGFEGMVFNPRDTVVPLISRQDLAEYMLALDLDEDQRAVAAELHEQYAERAREAAGEDSRIARRFPSMEEGGDPVAAAQRTIEARRRAFDAIVREDDRLFDDLAVMFSGHAEQIERLRLARERRRYASGRFSMPAMGWGMAGTAATSIDLARMVRQQRIDLSPAPQAEAALAEYERELTALLREHHEQNTQVAEMQTLFMAESMAGAEGGGVVAMGRGDEMREEMQRRHRMQQQLSELSRTIHDLHRNTLEALRAQIEPADGDALLWAYRRAAYPQVYNDRMAMEQTLARTLQMDDLTASQRDRLAEMLAEYRSAYWDLTEKMREVAEEMEAARLDRGDDLVRGRPAAPARRVSEEFQTLAHERQELSARTILRLRGVLSDEQLSRLGPLPDADPRARFRGIGW